MITKRFVENILYCFDELGYQIYSNPKQDDFEEAAKDLLEQSLDNGGKDNITAVTIKV